jgi:hypothetical protein
MHFMHFLNFPQGSVRRGLCCGIAPVPPDEVSNQAWETTPLHCTAFT